MNLPPLPGPEVPIVDADGRPTPTFRKWLRQLEAIIKDHEERIVVLEP